MDESKEVVKLLTGLLAEAKAGGINAVVVVSGVTSSGLVNVGMAGLFAGTAILGGTALLQHKIAETIISSMRTEKPAQ